MSGQNQDFSQKPKTFQEIIKEEAFPVSGMSDPTPLLPGKQAYANPDTAESPDLDGQMNMSHLGQGPTHGFPMAPLSALEERLNAFEEEDEIDALYWSQFKADEPYLVPVKIELDEHGNEIEIYGEEEIEDNPAFNAKELMAPMSKQQLIELRKKKLKKEAEEGRQQASTPKQRTIMRCFTFGSPINAEDQYDYDADMKEYCKIHDKVVAGKAVLCFEEVSSIERTQNYKVLMKVVEYVDD